MRFYGGRKSECAPWKRANKGRSCHGSRRQVWNGTALKTSGGLKKSQLMKRKGRIVSRKASQRSQASYKKNKNFSKYTKKGAKKKSQMNALRSKRCGSGKHKVNKKCVPKVHRSRSRSRSRSRYY